MTIDLYPGLYDETDDDTPIWNDLLDEYRDRLAEVGLLYEPPRPVVTVELPDPPAGPDPQEQPDTDPSSPHGEPIVNPTPENPQPLPGSPVPGEPHPSDAPRTSSPTGVALGAPA